MDTEPIVYYQAPAGHEAHIRGMVKGLAAFFIVLFLCAVLFFLFAHRIVAWLPFAVEQRFVRPYEVMAERWLTDQLGDPEVEEALQELADELALAMDLPGEIELKVHYLKSPEVNAFATLGGHIFILRGLVESVPDENSLAMVLAHEISHIQHRDPVTSLGRGVVLQIMIIYFAGGSTHGENLSSLGGQLGLLRYSRQQEERSDLDALQALNRHYGHVGGYDVFFEGVLETEGDTTETPDWLQTHPDLTKRMEQLRAAVEEAGYVVREERKPLPFPRTGL